MHGGLSWGRAMGPSKFEVHDGRGVSLVCPGSGPDDGGVRNVSRPAPPKAALTILVSIDGFRAALSFDAVRSKIVVA